MRRLHTVLNSAARLIFESFGGLITSRMRSSDFTGCSFLSASSSRSPFSPMFSTAVHHRTSDHLPSWPTYLVAEISDPLARWHPPPRSNTGTGTSFRRRRLSISGCWSTTLEHFTVGGDVSAVAGDILQATKDLLVRAVITEHNALILFYCFIALLHLHVFTVVLVVFFT